MSVNLASYEIKNWNKMCFVILRDLPFFWPFCEAYTRRLLQLDQLHHTFGYIILLVTSYFWLHKTTK